MPAQRIEWNDSLRIHEVTREYAAEIRDENAGPRFLECLTYRWKEHVGPNEDWAAGYRSRDEAVPWFERDEVPRVGAMVDPAIKREIDESVERQIDEAIAFAESSPFPGASELYADMY
jgi:TPP-dependent pyruvate/acetoin dehydrogenase alpha subunit